jgi:hypothetical protein
LAELFDRKLVVGVDAYLPGDLEAFFGDLAGGEFSVLDEGAGGGEGVAAAGADGDDALVGLDDVAASRWRSMRSVRQSLASSTAERPRLPAYCSSLASKREKSEKASAVEPANPARTLSW